LGEHSGMAQVLRKRRPASATALMLGSRGGVRPPYPKVAIWSMPTASMMTNRIVGEDAGSGSGAAAWLVLLSQAVRVGPARAGAGPAGSLLFDGVLQYKVAAAHCQCSRKVKNDSKLYKD